MALHSCIKMQLCLLFLCCTLEVALGVGLYQARRQTSPLAGATLLRDSKKTQPDNVIPREDTPSAEDTPTKPTPGPAAFTLPELPVLQPVVFVKPNETEAERAERIHRAFEKLMTFVDIMGQVDNYVSTKMKSFVKSVSHFYEGKDDEDAQEVVGDAKPACLHCPKCSKN